MSGTLDKIFGSFSEQLNDQIKKDIERIYKNIDDKHEFEVMFFNYKHEKNMMGFESFLRIMKFLNYRGKSSKEKLEDSLTLDIIYTKQENESFRISINGLNKINKYIERFHQRKNHVIFSALAGMNDKDITIIKKIRSRDNIVDVDDFDLRMRMAEELEPTNKEMEEITSLPENVRDNIIFRYKQRISLIIDDTKDAVTRIDLTNTKMSKDINRVYRANPIYELEIDLSSKIKSLPDKYLQNVYSEVNKLLKIIQQSNYLTSKTIEDMVLNSYHNLLNVNREQKVSLAARQSVSLEVQHVFDKLPNKYAVTDKADGERHFLIIINDYVFLISNNLIVKNTGIKITNKKYNNTVLDGEYVFIPSQNKHVFMGFDCLLKGGEDMRPNPVLLERLNAVDEVVKDCFISKGQVGYKFEDYKGEFDMDKISKFYEKQIANFMDALNKDLDTLKNLPLVRRKMFIAALGAKPSEIFKYSQLIHEKFVFDKSVNCPYVLDGLMYHPLDQKYTLVDSKYSEYKWKPSNQNSIDFYVIFERNKDTGRIVNLFDNSREEYVRGKAYQIVNLYVGKRAKGAEQPVLFEPEIESVKSQAYIFLKDGEVRDEEGNILQDRTVVEFYYNNDPNIPDKFRWVPMRTRHDKTESVRRFGKKYGNNFEIANKIWRSIKNPFSMADIKILANPDTYDKHIKLLKSKIDYSIILSEAKENQYQQIRTHLGKPMRNFHNFIKSILIYTNFHYMYENDRHLTVLDYGCGDGRDLMQFYYVEVDSYVGIDDNINNLNNPLNGIISRYGKLRKQHPNFPRMSFVHADGGALLEVDIQKKVLGNMEELNETIMNKFFSKDKSKKFQFDRIRCEFTISKYLANDTLWNNFTQNIKNHLKPGGYILITTFDADQIVEVLDDKEQYTSLYTNDQGEQKILFDIVKKYKDIKKGDLIKPGNLVDYYNSLERHEGDYIGEFLVQRKFLEKELKDKCDLELVETDLFYNQFQVHKEYFNGVYLSESKDETKKFLANAAQYYDETSEINLACYQLTKLFRFYIFRKN